MMTNLLLLSGSRSGLWPGLALRQVVDFAMQFLLQRVEQI
jgi:hypothetical protein